MTNTFRAMCAELVKDFDDLRESSEGVAGFHRNGDLAPWEELSESGRYPWLSSFDRARALLAQPEPEGEATPNDDDAWFHELVSEIARVQHVAAGEGQGPRFDLAEAVARFGHPTPEPPVDGEVGEVIAVLRGIQDCFDIASGMEGCGPFVARAADLLERLASPACLVITPSPEALASFKAAGPGEFIPFCEEGK